jgi:hypothetical protein
MEEVIYLHVEEANRFRGLTEVVHDMLRQLVRTYITVINLIKQLSNSRLSDEQ